MRTPIIIQLLLSLFAASCKTPMPPTDKEMIQHFNSHKATFGKIYEIIAESSVGSFHYPPLSPDEIIVLDSVEQSDTLYESKEEQDIPVYGLLKPDRIQLDSLLAEIGCGFILVDRKEQEKADSLNVSLVIPYYAHGLSSSVTSKYFIYHPGLRNDPMIRMTEHDDLNKIYRRTYNDTTLYKPIKGNWYIKLEHAR